MINPNAKHFPAVVLALLLLAYFVLAVASSFVTRLGYGPDEPAHFIYVREIGEHFRMPLLARQTISDISSHATHEAHQPLLYYALCAVPYAASRAMGADLELTWRIIRIFTSLIGVVWVYFLYKLAGEFYGERRYASMLAAACVGFLPLSTYMGGVVNNDVCIAALFTAALWLMARSLRVGEISRRTGIAIGVISGLAILAKAQGLFLPPMMAITGLIVARRHGWRASRATLVNIAAAVGISVLLGAGWFIRNLIIHGSLVANIMERPGWKVCGSTLAVVASYLFKYFWTPFWIVDPFVWDPAYAQALLAFTCLVFIAAIMHLYRYRDPNAETLDRRLDGWLLLIIPLILMYSSLVYQVFRVDRGLMQQGRLLLPAAPILGIAIVSGFGAFFRRPDIRVAAGFLFALGLLGANLLVLGLTKLFYGFS